MEVTSSPSFLEGSVVIPGSKSHTVRGVILAGLAQGISILEHPLDSEDTRSAAHASEAFGAEVTFGEAEWIIKGNGGKPIIPGNVVDVGNSGTTLYMAMGTAGLVDGWTVLTGDSQIRRRTAEPLIESLRGLGSEVFSTRGNGCAPLAVKGVMKGGKTSVKAVSSQYLSSLLMACPLAMGDSEINVIELNERPYVNITLDWLSRLGVELKFDPAMTLFQVKGGQGYSSFRRRIPGDFSTATFLFAAGALAGGKLLLKGLDVDDPQGDREIIGILRQMGARIEITGEGIEVYGSKLKGAEIDLNSNPDAVPMLAVAGCFAEGETVLYNVPQARIKETDRLGVMAAELTKLGARIEELPDGLVIKGGGLKGGRVNGHGDHRIVMALAVAGLAADGEVTVETAEAAGVTFPGFWEVMSSLGANFK